MGEVEDEFFITGVHKFPIAIVGLYVVNTFILGLNKGIHLTDVHIWFLNWRGITRILAGRYSIFAFVMPNLLLLCSTEPTVLIRRVISLGNMGTIIDRVLGRESMYPSPTTEYASSTLSSASRSSSAPLTSTTTLVSVNTQDVAIDARVTRLTDHKKFSNIACYWIKDIAEGLWPADIVKTSVNNIVINLFNQISNFLCLWPIIESMGCQSCFNIMLIHMQIRIFLPIENLLLTMLL